METIHGKVGLLKSHCSKSVQTLGIYFWVLKHHKRIHILTERDDIISICIWNCDLV